MELQALKEQLEVERRLWEANCAKKEVGGGRSLPPGVGSASGPPQARPGPRPAFTE